MTISSKARDHRHAEGQKDAAKGYGNYDPPHGTIHEILSDNLKEENDAYRDGYRNGAEQRGQKS